MSLRAHSQIISYPAELSLNGALLLRDDDTFCVGRRVEKLTSLADEERKHWSVMSVSSPMMFAGPTGEENCKMSGGAAATAGLRRTAKKNPERTPKQPSFSRARIFLRAGAMARPLALRIDVNHLRGRCHCFEARTEPSA